MQTGRLLLWLACLGALLFSTAHAEVPVPPLTSRVTDLTNTLTPGQQAALEQKLKDFEAGKGSQIAVLIVPSTRPEAIEQYSMRVAEQWKLGRKGVDDGALLLIAKDDRELRIEVGYGLEGVIPDAVAKRVIEEIIIPRFRQDDFYGGIEDGVERLIRLVEGEPLPPARQKSIASLNFNSDLLFFALAAVFVVGGILRALLGRFVGAAVAGGVASFIFWMMLGSLLWAAVVWVLVFLFVLAGGGGFRHRGGWSGGGFGGGGFSGGGGGFGGGGASGRW